MAATWRVIGQRQVDDLTPAGFFVPVWEVTAEVIATGVLVTVKIPERDYTAETVASRLDTMVAQVAAVDRLGNQ